MYDKKLFRIGEVSKMFKLSVGTLRHYEKLELIIPEYVNKETGYRYYGIKQFEILNTIKYLRALDIPLNIIANFLNNRDINKINDMLNAQKQIVVNRQKELKVIENKIDNRIKQINYALSGVFDKIFVKKIKSRSIAWLQKSFYLKSSLDLEIPLRQLDKSQSDSIIFLGKVGIGISKEKLLEHQYEYYDRVFILVEPEDKFIGQVEILPEELCAILRFHGDHKDSIIYYKRITDFILKNNFCINGFSKEITFIDYGVTNDKNNFVTEIQIPIKLIKNKI
ncbi:MAG: MerR family transcriptional regulator [Pleomorphochaeta sp.]